MKKKKKENNGKKKKRRRQLLCSASWSFGEERHCQCSNSASPHRATWPLLRPDLVQPHHPFICIFRIYLHGLPNVSSNPFFQCLHMECHHFFPFPCKTWSSIHSQHLNLWVLINAQIEVAVLAGNICQDFSKLSWRWSKKTSCQKQSKSLYTIDLSPDGCSLQPNFSYMMKRKVSAV